MRSQAGVVGTRRVPPEPLDDQAQYRVMAVEELFVIDGP